MKTKLPNSSQPVQITANFGVASFRIGSEKTVDSLIKRVDEAMYEAKRKGRNCVCVADE